MIKNGWIRDVECEHVWEALEMHSSARKAHVCTKCLSLHYDDANLQQWIDEKLALIANSLPETVKQPASFKCGHDMGYKQALLDLERFLYQQFEELKEIN